MSSSGGNGQERVDDPHHHRVDPFPGVARDRAPRGADDAREQGRREADLERGLPADHQAPQHVVTKLIGAERMRPAGTLRHLAEVGLDLVGHVDVRANEAEQHHEYDEPEAQHRQAVLHEHARDQAPDAARAAALAAVARQRLRRQFTAGSAARTDQHSSALLPQRGEPGRLPARAGAGHEYRTRGSATAYKTSATSEPSTVAIATTTVNPSITGKSWVVADVQNSSPIPG